MALKAEVPIWDATDAECLSDLWSKVKQDCSGNKLVEKAEISVAIPNKFTIIYEYGLDLDIKERNDEREMIEGKLKETLKALDFDPPTWVQKSSR